MTSNFNFNVPFVPQAYPRRTPPDRRPHTAKIIVLIVLGSRGGRGLPGIVMILNGLFGDVLGLIAGGALSLPPSSRPLLALWLSSEDGSSSSLEDE